MGSSRGPLLLLQMFDIWLKHLDKGNLAAALFLDLSAGFDVINHRIHHQLVQHLLSGSDPMCSDRIGILPQYSCTMGRTTRVYPGPTSVLVLLK